MGWSRALVLLATSVITDPRTAWNCLEPVSMSMKSYDVTLRYSISHAGDVLDKCYPSVHLNILHSAQVPSSGIPRLMIKIEMFQWCFTLRRVPSPKSERPVIGTPTGREEYQSLLLHWDWTFQMSRLDYGGGLQCYFLWWAPVKIHYKSVLTYLK